jgi:hypothetical protein
MPMTLSFSRAVARLIAVAHHFDADGHAAKHDALRRSTRLALVAGAALPRYYEILLFLRAHPSDAALLAAVEAEFLRLTRFLGSRRRAHPQHLQEQGLPHVDMVTRFEHDCVRWLLAHPHCRIALDSYGEFAVGLNDVLRLTLPSVERSETTAGLDNDALLDALRVRKAARLTFLIDELSRLDALPYVKDHLYGSLELFVRVTPTDARFSKAFSRLPMRATFFQQELLRDFDAHALMNASLPSERRLGRAARDEIILVLKNAMALTSRETDPCTYLDERTLKVFDLERGLSVAIFGMTPARQLPLESYVGFTLFKNGLAAAYGGAWLLGRRAGFGMNIFEPYRGGESGLMMCQVLRVYRQSFGISFFEVDAHQFGLDNPDGIATGAFWFYYRYGFRPLDAGLRRLAEQERKKILRGKGHRSSARTLLRFTGSNVALNFGGPVPTSLFDLTTPITRMVQRRYGGDRIAAERDCVARFRADAGIAAISGEDQRHVLVEVALVAHALRVRDARRRGILRQMITIKPDDLWAYQNLWLDFFENRSDGSR